MNDVLAAIVEILPLVTIQGMLSARHACLLAETIKRLEDRNKELERQLEHERQRADPLSSGRV